mgnify:FL=1
MKVQSVRYLVKEGVKNTWANRLMSIASIGVLVACMVIIGLAVLISACADKAIGRLEQENVVMVYMKDYNWALYADKADTSSETAEASSEEEQPDKNGIKSSDYVIHNDEEANALCEKIEKITNVKKVEYISSDAGLEAAKNAMLEGQGDYFDFLNDDYGNPISAAAKVTMSDMSLFDATLDKIKTLDGVDTIQSNSDTAEMITSVKNGIAVAGIVIMVILIIISLVIVCNTIRITMYNRKLEISIMKAVGATDSFVRIPFIVEGVLIGAISAVIAEALVYFCYRVATETIVSSFGANALVSFKSLAGILILIFLGVGVVAGVLGSIIIIGKYLRREGSEFAAI